MGLASIQGSAADASSSSVDAYLVEIYRQVAESTGPTATPRYTRVAAFLAFVTLAITALAVLVSLPDEASGPIAPAVSTALAAFGLAVSLAFYALDVHSLGESGNGTDTAGGGDTTSGIYLASTGFFTFTLAIAVALAVVR